VGLLAGFAPHGALHGGPGLALYGAACSARKTARDQARPCAWETKQGTGNKAVAQTGLGDRSGQQYGQSLPAPAPQHSRQLNRTTS
jgi:hypothetical protein